MQTSRGSKQMLTKTRKEVSLKNLHHLHGWILRTTLELTCTHMDVLLKGPTGHRHRVPMGRVTWARAALWNDVIFFLEKTRVNQKTHKKVYEEPQNYYSLKTTTRRLKMTTKRYKTSAKRLRTTTRRCKMATKRCKTTTKKCQTTSKTPRDVERLQRGTKQPQRDTKLPPNYQNNNKK